MELLEVLFTCDAGENNISCTAWDYRTGTNLINYKGGGCTQKNSLNLLCTDYVLAANNAKPLMHVWPINHQEQISATRFVLPGRVDALALSTDNCFLVAGIQETLYIWQIKTGRMMNSISKHYQPVTCICFTDTSSHFASGSRDGGILVWNLTQVVSRSGDDRNQTPLYSFNDHGLPVTDIHIGIGGMRAYMYTCSIDRTSKVYNLSNGSLLLNVVFPEALHCIKVNPLETCVYIGTAEGNIYEYHIDSVPRTKEYHIEKDYTNKFCGHKPNTIVNCLTLSLDGQTLISGGQDEQVCVWDIQSRQLIKTMQLKGAVTNLHVTLIHPTKFNPEHKPPFVFGGSLRRMIDPPEADDEEVMEVFITANNRPCGDKYDDVPTKQTSLPHPSTSEASTSKVASSTEKSANDEIEKLHAEINHLKKVNKELYEAAVHKTLFDKQ